MTVISTGGCTTGGSVGKGANLTPGTTVTPQVTTVAKPTGPGVPQEPARITTQDGKLLERFRKNKVPPGYEQPSEDTLAVIVRRADGAGHLGWMADEQTYCFASTRASGTLSTRCEHLPARHAPHIAAGPQLDGNGMGENYSYYTALVLDGQGRFSFTGPSKSLGPVHQATVVFPSGRTAALLVYEVVDRPFDTAAEICDDGRAHCFMATATMQDPDSP
ncbi:hypothetical protein [Streptomyces goshikiensis]|uniref:hypothetical protein n=1 Tax=Streptomyces goshikiensis TaxID=1942 RepID=UPI00331CED0E